MSKFIFTCSVCGERFSECDHFGPNDRPICLSCLTVEEEDTPIRHDINDNEERKDFE